MLETDVVPGVHRIEDAYTNWYLVEDDDGVSVVDTGVPSSWASFRAALQAIGRNVGDVRAVVLTHAHFDHVGFAERARRELGVPVHVHENRGPRVVARAATADSDRNLRTLDALAATGATTALTGHGEPWRGGVAVAVEQARSNGVA